MMGLGLTEAGDAGRMLGLFISCGNFHGYFSADCALCNVQLCHLQLSYLHCN